MLFGLRSTAPPTDKIALLQIIEAVDGPLGQYGHAELPPMSAKAKTAVEGAFAAIKADARKRLAAITLSDLRVAKAA